MNYVAFSIKAATPGDYRLAIRAASGTQPTSKEIKDSSATIVRSLTSTPINVFMGFHMDTTLFDTSTDWESVDYKGATDKTLKQDVVDAAALQENTAYKLFAVKEDGSNEPVYEILSFKTDEKPTKIEGEYYFYNFPVEYTYTLKQGEPFLLQVSLNEAHSTLLLSEITGATSSLISTLSYTKDSYQLPTFGANPGYFFASFATSSPKTFSVVSKTFVPDASGFTGFEWEHGTGHIISAKFTLE